MDEIEDSSRFCAEPGAAFLFNARTGFGEYDVAWYAGARIVNRCLNVGTKRREFFIIRFFDFLDRDTVAGAGDGALGQCRACFLGKMVRKNGHSGAVRHGRGFLGHGRSLYRMRRHWLFCLSQCNSD